MTAVGIAARSGSPLCGLETSRSVLASKSAEVDGRRTKLLGRKEDPELVFCTGVRVTLARKVREEQRELEYDEVQLQRVDAEISRRMAGQGKAA